MKKYIGPILLFCASIIWGGSFIIMKNAVSFLPSSTLLFIRFLIASVILTVIFFKQIRGLTKKQFIYALICGVCLYCAFYVQTVGLLYTTPSKNAFLTAVYCAIVPFLVWLIYKEKPDSYSFIAAFISIIGIALVSLTDSLLNINIGDLLTLIGGVFYAIHIILNKAFSKEANGVAFTIVQFYSATILSFIVALLFEDISVIKNISSQIYLQLLYLGVLATGLCLIFQTVGQQKTSECYASLILSLESVFGVLFSVIFYKEVLTFKVVLGFILIFIAITISQTKLSFLKKASKVMMVLLIIFTTITINNTYAASDWNFNGKYAYVYDMTTNQQLCDKNSETKIYPASTTKVMTALVALENMKDMDTIVTVTKEDLEGLWEAQASVANFEVGEKVTYRDLIYGIILPSGADACRVTARVLFGSEEKMVEKMNEKAKSLGLVNTHFTNITGLHDSNHYTCVKDIGTFTKQALKNSFFKKVFTTRYYHTEIKKRYMAATILKFHWHTGRDITHIVGCKTGYTKEAKSCITALVNSQNQDIICVFASEKDSASYVEDCKKVVNYCDSNYKSQTVFQKGQEVASVKVKGGVEKKYSIRIDDDINLFLRNDESINDYSLEYKGVDNVEAPTVLNDKLGKINVKYNDNTLISYNVVMEKEIDATVFTKIINFIFPYFLIIIIVLLVLIYIVAHLIRYNIRKKRRARRRARR